MISQVVAKGKSELHSDKIDLSKFDPDVAFVYQKIAKDWKKKIQEHKLVLV